MRHRQALLALLVTLVSAQFSATSAADQPLSAAQVPQRYMPVAYCPRTDTPPAIDGVLDDECWKSAEVLGEFVSDKKDAFPSQPTEVRILRDDKWIYFACRCREQDMAHQKVHRTGRGMPWDEDSIELFVDASRGDSDYKQFCANVLGANNLPLPKGQEDAVVVAGKAGSDEWTLEARLLIEGVAKTQPKPGDVWGLNISRNRQRDKGAEGSSWARIKGSYHMPDLYGLLVFCDKIPAARVTAIDLGSRYEGQNVARVTTAGKAGSSVSVSMTSQEKSRESTGPLAADGRTCFGIPYALGGGFNSMTLTVASGDQTLLKTDLRAASVTRPQWAKYVTGYGLLALAVEQDVLVQGEAFSPCLDVVREGAAQGGPRVTPSLQQADQAPVRLGEGANRLAADWPDGEATLSAQVPDVDSAGPVTLQRKIALAGERLDRWQRQVDDLQARIEKIRPKMHSAEMLLSLDKARAKVNRLADVMKLRDLVRAGAICEEATAHVASLETGELPVWGHREGTYLSRIDGTEQPYVVIVPKDYDPKGTDRRPALIWLHCFIGDGPWPRDSVISEYMGPMERACLKKGYLLIQPFGRGSQGYRGDGQADVWDVWELASRQYRIDPDRVYLGGFSMGGSGTCHLGATFPQRFAAGAAYSGGMSPDLAGNLRYLPMRFECGGQEEYSVGVQRAYEAVKKVPGRTAETIFVPHPNEGHTSDYVDFEALLDWFSQYRRIGDPAAVTCAAPDLGRATNYWVSIEAFEQYGKPAAVEAAIEKGTLKVTTSNVASAVFTPSASLLASSKPLQVVLNGKQVPGARIENGRIVLACTTQPARPVAAAASRPVVHKSPALSGPIASAYGGPLMLVVAGSGDGSAGKGARLISNRWARWHHGVLEPIAEDKADAAALASHNIILVGAWSRQGLMGKVGSTAPVRIEAGAITVSGQTQEGKDLGTIFLQPNPLNPEYYIVVVTGQKDTGIEAACRIFEQEQFGGDYVFTVKQGEGFVHGFFDHQWQ